MKLKLLALINLVALFNSSYSLALPPPEDVPEEVLRTEIILEGRSPVDGQPLSAAEYEELQAELAQSPYRPELESDVQQIIFLLQIRKFFKTVIPFY
ncbi:MAG: hypothetical protein ACRC06_07495 [Waterburya sp.]